MVRVRASWLASLGLVLLAGGGARADTLRDALGAAQQAIAQDDAQALAKALETVATHDDKAAARGLLRLVSAVPEGHEAAYWQVTRALGALQSEKALKEVGKFLEKQGQTQLARDVLFSFQGNPSPAALALYGDLLKGRKVDPGLQLLVCDRLGELASVEAVDLLVEALTGAPDSERGRQARQVLVALVGEDMGAPVNWKGWWKQQRAQGLPRPEADATGTGTVVDHVDAARRGGLRTSTGQGRVVVVVRDATDYDHIERVLERMQVPHEVLTREDFKQDPQAALKGTAALLFNCVGLVGCVCPGCRGGEHTSARTWTCNPKCKKHDYKDYTLQGEALKAVKDFVEVRGGAVFGEDFSMYDFVGKAWPEYVKVGPVLKERTVGFVPVPGQGQNPLLQGVFERGKPGETHERFRPFDGKWKVDGDSPMIDVVDPERVDVLLVSPELRQEHESGGAVAVAFHPGPGTEPGPGLVLHVLSHFGKQSSQDDEYALQNLLVNFLLEAQARYAQRQGQ